MWSTDRLYTELGVRGFQPVGDFNSRILLLIDGYRTNDNLYDQAPIGREFPLDVDLIERVEIVRGPGSSVYGGNAVLAVINVITKSAGDSGGAEVSGSLGSYGTHEGRASNSTPRCRAGSPSQQPQRQAPSPISPRLPWPTISGSTAARWTTSAPFSAARARIWSRKWPGCTSMARRNSSPT